MAGKATGRRDVKAAAPHSLNGICRQRKLTIDYASGEVGEKLVEETMGRIDKQRIDAIKKTTLREFYEH